jgi:lysophospholipase L1-like esterase
MADRFLGFYSNNATVHKDSVSVEPNDSSSMQAVYLVGALNPQNGYKKDLFIPVKPVPTSYGSGRTKKVLLIGDSLTEIGKYQNYVNDYFENDGMSVEWLGSKVSNFGLRNEGRYGWRAYTYTHFAQTTAQDGEGSAATNAFWNPLSNKFDFAYYMTQQGYSDVDIVFINLGTNDFARANHSTEADVLSAWSEIIESIHAYNANINIVLWMCPPACLMNGIGAVFSAIYQHYIMRKLIWDNWTSNQWGRNNIWIMPSHLCIDPVHGFPSHMVARNQYDQETIEEATDLVHLSDSGYQQLANPIIAMIKYLGSLN